MTRTAESETAAAGEIGTDRSGLPRHVAIIMDGNGRWARSRGLPRVAGHKAGRKPVRETVEECARLGIEYLTLYTFSSENWNRPRAEIKALMAFLRQVLLDERQSLLENNIRFGVIGRTADLPREVQDELRITTDLLSGNTGLNLILALSYGSRTELVDCFRRISAAIRAGELKEGEIDESVIDRHLYTSGIPNPDLLIRTSGEMRLSNFLLWQLAYAEIYVTDTLWPDFRTADLHQALAAYRRRDRRFGRVD